MMQINTILDHIDNGHMALPEFQRGYVWNRGQVRGLFDSLYRRHPVGGLLVWATESKAAVHRGDGTLAAGIVKLLLDGQQRITSLYGVLRGKPPEFFDGDDRAFTGLRFHLRDEVFEFYQPVKMREDKLWIDVTKFMQEEGINKDLQKVIAEDGGTYLDRIVRLRGIREVELHIDEITDENKSIDIVVDIFNRVNSGGTKLSKGDLALAKICADWPDARSAMKDKLDEWECAGYRFTKDWLLRSVNTVLTGKAEFQHLHDKSASEVQDGLARATRHLDQCLNFISGRLGLDHDRVFFGRFGTPVMARYLDLREARNLGPINERERDKLLFWYVQSAMWGRFSGSTETIINQDLEALESEDGSLDKLLEQLHLWHDLRTEPAHFKGSSRGARFYPVLYLLTRMGDARDWGTGITLRADLLGKMNRLEVHHIFPKAKLNQQAYDYKKSEVNAIANFCFLTKETNLNIRDRSPEDYFPQVEESHRGALASQWIPEDPTLWKVERFRDFLAARQELLAKEFNRRMEDLLHGDQRWMSGGSVLQPRQMVVPEESESNEEEGQLDELNVWVAKHGLCQGELAYDFSDPHTGEQKAVLDLAWPDGLQAGLTEPVAVLLNEEASTLEVANQGGFRCFRNAMDFRYYVEEKILGELEYAEPDDRPKDG